MTDKPIKSALRMRKRHTPRESAQLGVEDGKRLSEEQSLRSAVIAGLVVIILFSILWAMLSTLTNRIFPWMTLLLGIAIGLVVRRGGRGLDWRFPLLAAVLALMGAVLGNIIVAAAFTAAALETTTFAILRAVTSMTWPVFFAEAVSSADIVYGAFSAAIAAFYANRRLNRDEFQALRRWQEANIDVEHD